MKKNIILCLALVATLFSCQNGSQKEIESLSERCTSDSTMCFKVPSYMMKTKEDAMSIQFEGDKKIVKIMKTELPDKWDMCSFAQYLIGNNRGNLTLVEQNDSLMVYEIHKGATRLSACVFSLHERNGYSVLLTTIGLNAKVHDEIGETIYCTRIEDEQGSAVISPN